MSNHTKCMNLNTISKWFGLSVWMSLLGVAVHEHFDKYWWDKRSKREHSC